MRHWNGSALSLSLECVGVGMGDRQRTSRSEGQSLQCNAITMQMRTQCWRGQWKSWEIRL